MASPIKQNDILLNVFLCFSIHKPPATLQQFTPLQGRRPDLNPCPIRSILHRESREVHLTEVQRSLRPSCALFFKTSKHTNSTETTRTVNLIKLSNITFCLLQQPAEIGQRPADKSLIRPRHGRFYTANNISAVAPESRETGRERRQADINHLALLQTASITAKDSPSLSTAGSQVQGGRRTLLLAGNLG